MKKCYKKSKKERNILENINRRVDKLIGHILRRNCFLKHVFEGKIERRIGGMEGRGRRRKQLLDGLKKEEDTVNWKGKH